MNPPIIAEKDGTLKSVGERILRINPNWKNPSGMYRVGIKRAFEFFPRELVSRLKENRKKGYGKDLRMVCITSYNNIIY